ncbi:MAG: type IV toxin-antitoxin system AbiEi family antitoxin domain-containing protein [Lachnospiraceae bacterium]|nr:type IV toxin-antitoxin system AbiEi family antitoxin domain-containing protein [Lachnospiraceae bacterium]
MRVTTYCKLNDLYKKYCGYISTNELLYEGFSNRQIASLTEENYLEKVCHGYYWMLQSGYQKPMDYKCIEVCLGSPRAVVALESACYYQGVIQKEPKAFKVVTERTDRSVIKMKFPTQRHYFSKSNFNVGMKRVDTPFGSYHIYNIERSFCDMMRLRDEALENEVMIEVQKYVKMGKGQYERVLKYAEMLKLNCSLPADKK